MQHQLDDLELTTNSSKLNNVDLSSSAKLYSAEVKFLNQQVQHLQLENAKLSSSVKQKESQIAEFRRTMEEERKAFGGSKAIQRIVELSRRNRDLAAEVAVERNKVAILERKAAVNSQCKVKEPEPVAPPSLPNQENLQEKNGLLQEELSSTKKKLTECRNQCQVLKQDLKLAHRALVKEVGEGVSLNDLLTGESGWKGRAQQIAALQTKLIHLRQQTLQSHGGTDSGTKHFSEENSHHLDRQKIALRKLEQDRKRSLDDTKADLEALKDEHGKMQQQCVALKVRNRTVVEEMKCLKSQVAFLVKKSEKDESLIKSLRDDKQWERKTEQLKKSSQLLQQQLEERLKELEHRHPNPTGTGTQFDDSIEEERSVPTPKSCCGATLSLPPLVQPSSDSRKTRTKAGNARKSVSAGSQLFDKQKLCDVSQAQALLQVAEVERSRLLELNLVLQQRLDTCQDRMGRADLSRNHMHKVQAETQTSGCGGKVSKLYEEVSILKEKLEWEMHDKSVLKENLSILRQEKIEDIKLFHSMLREAKQAFSDTVKNLRDSLTT